MPIQTNLSLETALYHVPIPASKADVRRLNDCWKRQPPRNGRIVARHTAQGLILKVAAPVVLIAVAGEYWQELGRMVKRTGEVWWDICAVVVDSEPQKKKPNAHALSLYRVTAKGKLHYLHHEELPDGLDGPAGSRRRKPPSSTAIAKLIKKWRFAPDAVGIFSGPRDLSLREGFGRR